jgi:ribosomal-protein-alanine N-acetyltransferase
MSPAEMAAIHAAAFVVPRPWDAEEIAGLLGSPLCFALSRPDAFLIGRVVAGEAEVLTVAVGPNTRRQGSGRALLAGFLAEAQARLAKRAFLEVAADNHAAICLYQAAGFCEIARRKRYYATAASAVDALIFSKDLHEVDGQV